MEPGTRYAKSGDVHLPGHDYSTTLDELVSTALRRTTSRAVADGSRAFRYFFTISISSTSKTSVAPGLIVGGRP